MINCAIYPRKSKESDNSDSMDAQKFMCIEYLNAKYGKGNYNVTIYDGDYGITGHSTQKRKDFQRMMQDIKDRKIQLVLIQRYDRIARNTRDFCNIYHDMEQVGCNLISVSQNIDTTTPYGKKFMYDQASMAELEWALCSERRKDINRYARINGKCTLSHWNCPFGYTVEIIDGIRKMVKQKENESLVYEIYSLYHEYGNFCRVAKIMNERHGTKFTNRTISNIIKNPIYKGEYHENKNFCEPYFTEEEWDSYQINKQVIRDDLRKKSEVVFGGLIACPCCGRMLHGTLLKQGHRPNYRWYRCEKYKSTRLCTFSKGKSEQQIEKILLDKMETFMQNAIATIEIDGKDAPAKKNVIDKTQAELDRLNTMYLKGRIKEDFYDAEYLRLSNILSAEEANSKPQGNIENASKILSGNWKEMYQMLDSLHKKMFWRSIISRIVIDENADITNIIFL